ncbi:hypothetical protein B0H14DRAFT_3502072 [Mycena olivaceomarginata]|nr:hypothetical protein B0H14DRAFT_3502072 [Mycena olivaceomarginata]
MGLGSVVREIRGLRAGEAKLDLVARGDLSPPAASPATIGVLALLCSAASETALAALAGMLAANAVAPSAAVAMQEKRREKPYFLALENKTKVRETDGSGI